MNRSALVRALVCVLLLAGSRLHAQAPAQQPPAAPPPATDSVPPATVTRADDVPMMFDREVFDYPGRSRRDPFMPLTGSNAGPLFDELKLQMILYVQDSPRESIVQVADATNKTYRLRRGESVGTATVVDIGPTRVVFSVSDFGISRQEVLELRPNRRD